MKNASTTIKVNPQEYDMLMQSFNFIHSNQDLTNNHIPDDLLDFWLIKDFTTNPDYRATEAQLLVFMYILRIHFRSVKKIETILFKPYFYQLFHYFQVILASTAYSRKYNIPISPFPIFNIAKYKLPDFTKGQELLKYFRIITHTYGI